ncbi:MAG: glycosyltransferase family 2 protein [Anaerolineales bacterium]|nr:glycosyltransferase family 2 protein [Anaerolineales bacterium]
MPPAIIILNYNGVRLLGACLSSLRQLTVPAEIIVADNASTDDSLAMLRAQWPDVRVLGFEQNWGFAEGYNRALAQVDNEWVVLLNNDASLAPDWLEVLLKFAEAQPQAAILGGKLLFGEPGGERVLQAVGACFTDAGTAFEVGWGERDDGQYDRPRRTASVPGAALLMRRAVFHELGGFDPTYFAYLEDVDLCWRAWLAGYEVWVVPQAVAWHHFGASSGGRASPFRIRWMQRNRYANMLKHLEWPTLLGGTVTSVGYDLYRVLEFTLRGEWTGLRALAAGTLDFAHSLPQVLQERQRVQSRRRRRDAELKALGLLAPALTAFREYRRLARLERSRRAAMVES